VPGRGLGVIAVAFVAVAVAALAVVPVVMGRQAAEAQRQVTDILGPARLLSARLSLVQAREMSLFQSFLLGGDPTYRSRYLESLNEEQQIYEQLQELIGGMDLEIRAHLARLSSVSSRWHVGHQAVFESEEVRAQILEELGQGQATFDELQQASFDELQLVAVELEREIQGEVDVGRRRSARLRVLQTRITLGLVILGLGATVAIGAIGWHLRTLTAEGEARRWEAVRARRENEAVLEATGDGVLGIDLQGRCISLNRAGCELLGYKERELAGRDVFSTLFHTTADGEPRSREDSRIMAALQRDGSVRSPTVDVIWRKDGTALPAQWSLRPLVDGMEVRGGVVTFTDMTEILEKEQALRRAVRVREEVVSVVSHDLRNPLGVVRAAAELLLDLPLEEGERNKQAHIIRRSADRMSRLIGDLLDISRIEAGALVVRPAKEDPREVLEETQDFFRPQTAERGIELEVDVDPATPPLLVDRDRVAQALLNLLDNALKFTPEGGRISLAARPGPEGHVVIDVSDTGPGVSEEAMAHLFDRFWQDSRHDRTGSGLGLAIVRGIAEAHGGTADVTSRPHEGATFSLVLPAAPGGAPTPETG
jgi:PAS domain S-box-containing protein